MTYQEFEPAARRYRRRMAAVRIGTIVIILAAMMLSTPYLAEVGSRYGRSVAGALTAGVLALPSVLMGLAFSFLAGRLIQRSSTLHCAQCRALLAQECWPTLIVARARCAKCGAVVIADEAAGSTVDAPPPQP